MQMFNIRLIKYRHLYALQWIFSRIFFEYRRHKFYVFYIVWWSFLLHLIISAVVKQSFGALYSFKFRVRILLSEWLMEYKCITKPCSSINLFQKNVLINILLSQAVWYNEVTSFYLHQIIHYKNDFFENLIQCASFCSISP